MIDWLRDAFGFEKHAVYADGDTVHHAQLVFGNGMVMIGSAMCRRVERRIVQADEIDGRETRSLRDRDADAPCTRESAAR